MHAYHNYHAQSRRFAHKEIREMFLFQLFKEIGFGIVGIFVPIYLYTQGVPLIVILLAALTRSAIHGLFAQIAARFFLLKVGIKHTFVLTMALYAVSFFIIEHQPTALVLWGWVVLSGMTNALYASAHHAYLAINVDKRAAGTQVATLGIVATIAGIITPFVGALFITLFGFQQMFIAGAGLLIVSVVPLFFSKETSTANQVCLSGFSHLKEFWTERRPIARSTIANGFNGSSDPLWDSLYIYKLFGGIRSLGGIRTIISILQICVSYVSGKFKDKGRNTFTTGINASIVARLLTFVSFNPYIAIMGETADGIVRPLFTTAYDANFYKALQGPHAISRVVAHESTWHAGHVLALSLIIVATYFYGWYAFLIVGFFMITGRFIIKRERVGVDSSETVLQ